VTAPASPAVPAGAVPAGAVPAGAVGGAVDPGADGAADGAVVEALLRCWVREHGLAVAPPELALRLAAGTLAVPVVAPSATGWHRFGPPRLDGVAVGAARLVAAMAGDLVARRRLTPAQGDDLVARTVASRHRIAHHAAARAGEPLALPPTFLDGEQGLVAGHPFHPAAKSRQGLSGAHLAASSPELGGSFRLRWLAVDRSLVATGSAAGRPAEALLAELGDAPPAPPGTTAVPLHPWQAGAVLARPAVARLVDAGALHDLGPGAGAWSPTSSLRTVWRPGAAWMLKLSLAVRVTNSRRDNRREELRLGEQAARLMEAGVGRRLAAAHPRFGVVTDPAWVGVDVAGGGFDTGIRGNPFPPGAPAVCVAALVDARPACGGPVLAALVHRLAAGTGRPPSAVAEEWVRRYVAEVVAPLAWLDATFGIVLEAHHQNTLVTLDAHGWPVGGWYRDNQGWYVAAGAAARLERLAPGAALDAVYDDGLVARRGAYYLGVNNVLGLVGALAAAGVADEGRLLAGVRVALVALPPSPVLDVLLDAPCLPCKANLLTCADGRDELDGPVEAQSVYVEVPNPLAGGRR